MPKRIARPPLPDFDKYTAEEFLQLFDTKEADRHALATALYGQAKPTELNALRLMRSYARCQFNIMTFDLEDNWYQERRDKTYAKLPKFAKWK